MVPRDFLKKNFLAFIYFKLGFVCSRHTQKESKKQWLHICRPLLNDGDKPIYKGHSDMRIKERRPTFSECQWLNLMKGWFGIKLNVFGWS